MARGLNHNDMNELLELTEQQLDLLGHTYELDYCENYPEKTGCKDYGTEVVTVLYIYGMKSYQEEPIPIDDVCDSKIVPTIMSELAR